MHQGFEFSKDFKPAGTDFQQKGFSQDHKTYGHNTEHKHVYNFKAPPFEEPSEGFQIPSQILELFVENKDKASHENKQKAGSRTSITSHSTVDSRNPNALNFAHPNAGVSSNMHGGNNGMKFPSFNSLLNQSNDFMMMKNNNVQNDLNTSNISNKDSRNVSMNNISRNSGDLNMSNSRRNQSSRAGPKANKNYQVTLNDDISLIERIEIMLNQITMNHNKACPFCSKTIDIKKCNFQNISALLSNTSKKYYLTHFDCYLKSNSNPASSKIVSLSNVIEAKVNSQINSLSVIDTSNFLRSDRKAYFVSLEGYHPVSSYLLFRIDKICHGLEHASHRNQLLYMNLTNKTTSIFEPSSYNIPFCEFRLCITVHMSHANEDPYHYEYLVDFSQVKLSAEQKNKFAEVVCAQEGNSMSIGTQIVYDPAVDLAPKSMANLDSSFQSTSSSTSAKPDFGKNVYVTLKHFTISLPLKRIERKAKEAQLAPVVEESPFDQANKSAAAQKKPHTRLQLNPHAPLFSNNNPQPEQPGAQQQASAQQQPQQPSFAPPAGNQGAQVNFGGQQFPGNKQQGQDSGNNAFQGFNASNPAAFFNTPGGFPQGLHSEQSGQHGQPKLQEFNFNAPFPRQNQGPQQPQGYPQADMMPPGLGLVSQPQNAMNFPGYSPQQMFQNQQQNNNLNQRGQNQGFQGFQNIPEGGYPSDNQHQNEQHHYQEEGGQQEYPSEGGYENYKPKQDSQSTMDRGRNRPSSLYTSVLSGKKRENSLSNSPSLHNMQNRYFSAASTPGSNYGQVDSPLSQSNNDFFGNDEPSNPPLSEDMIESFRLEDHLGELVEFAKSYNGSRILQKFFPKANQNEVEQVIHEIEGNLEELMLDPYANYMFQTLAQSCSADQRYFLLQKVAPSMVELASDRKGTHSLQSLIGLVSRDVEEKLLRNTLQNHIVELSFDPQGTHLVQKLITSISINNIDFVFEPLVQRFVEVANHSFGLCVLKQLITKVEKVPELRRRIGKLLYENLENLIQNPYGNYALQHSLDTFQGDCGPIFEKTFDRIVQYSNQKFSSNVIEKCLVVAAPELKKRFIREMVRNDRITELMKNKYGNFVLLKALKSVDTEDRQVIMQSIQRNLNTVSMAKYKNSWTKFIEENPLRIPSSSTNKPSLFRNNSQNSENLDRLEQSSPKQLSPWNDAKQGQGKGVKDDKSQFYLERGNAGGEAEGKNAGSNQPELGGGDDDRENRGLRENFAGMGGQQMAKKGKQTANQKFYDDKNQHYAANKWGFNNFY